MTRVLLGSVPSGWICASAMSIVFRRQRKRLLMWRCWRLSCWNKASIILSSRLWLSLVHQRKWQGNAFYSRWRRLWPANILYLTLKGCDGLRPAGGDRLTPLALFSRQKAMLLWSRPNGVIRNQIASMHRTPVQLKTCICRFFCIASVFSINIFLILKIKKHFPTFPTFPPFCNWRLFFLAVKNYRIFLFLHRK